MKHKRKEKPKAKDSQRADDKEQKPQENELEEQHAPTTRISKSVCQNKSVIRSVTKKKES